MIFCVKQVNIRISCQRKIIVYNVFCVIKVFLKNNQSQGLCITLLFHFSFITEFYLYIRVSGFTNKSWILYLVTTTHSILNTLNWTTILKWLYYLSDFFDAIHSSPLGDASSSSTCRNLMAVCTMTSVSKLCTLRIPRFPRLLHIGNNSFSS